MGADATYPYRRDRRVRPRRRLVDAFDFINQRFVPLTPRDVVSAVHNHRGFFASTASLRDGDYDPVFLTHHVTDYDPLDRFRADVAGRFDLGLIMTWQGEEIHREVLPFCRVDEEIQKAIDGGFDLLAVRIGTEKDFRRVAQFGMRLDKSNAYTLGLSAKADPQYLQTLLQNSVGEMLPELFDGNIQWDVDTPAGVELPTDMSRISDDSDMEDDEPVRIASEGSPTLFDMEPEREIAETDEATAHVEIAVTS